MTFAAPVDPLDRAWWHLELCPELLYADRQSTGKPIYIWCNRAGQVQASPQHGCAHWQLQVPARTAPLVIDRPPVAG